MKLSTFIPRWIRSMSFGEHISPILAIVFVIFALGILTIILGIIEGDPSSIVAGAIVMVPFIFLMLLLWRTYADDVYQRDI